MGTYRDTSLNKNPNLNVDLVYSKAFKKQGRKLLGSVVLNFNSHDKFEDVQDRYVLIDSSTATPKFTRVEQELYVRQNNGTDGVKASISYVEPFSPYSLLEIVYDYELTNMRTLRRVEDKLKSAEKGSLYYVDSLAVHYDYRFMSSRAGLNYQYTPNKMFRANIGFAVQPLVLSGNLPREDLYYEYANVNLVPTAGFKWRLNDEVDWSVDYIGKNNQPNFFAYYSYYR